MDLKTAKEVYILGAFGEVKCIIVHRDMRDYDVMAWDFCVNFARDNDLQVSLTAPETSAPKS
jgi:hypothetical protein